MRPPKLETSIEKEEFRIVSMARIPPIPPPGTSEPRDVSSTHSVVITKGEFRREYSLTHVTIPKLRCGRRHGCETSQQPFMTPWCTHAFRQLNDPRQTIGQNGISAPLGPDSVLSWYPLDKSSRQSKDMKREQTFQGCLLGPRIANLVQRFSEPCQVQCDRFDRRFDNVAAMDIAAGEGCTERRRRGRSRPVSFHPYSSLFALLSDRNQGFQSGYPR